MTHRPGSARIGRWKHALAGGAVVVCLLAAVDVAAAQRVTFERGGVVGFVEVPVDGYRRWGGLAMGSGVTSGYYVYASDAYAYRYFPTRYYPVRSYIDCGWQWRLAASSIGDQWLLVRGC
jgi:hypothetical protein